MFVSKEVIVLFTNRYSEFYKNKLTLLGLITFIIIWTTSSIGWADPEITANEAEPVQATNQNPESGGLSPVEYGTLYVMEQLDQEFLPWKTSLGYNFEAGNSYSYVHGITAVFERSLGRFTWIGVQGGYYFSAETQLMNAIQNQLKMRNVTAVIQNPSYSLYGIFTATPLSGHLNFLGNSPIRTELAIRVGVGRVAYQGSDAHFGTLWSIRPSVYPSKNFFVQLGIGQEIESIFTSNMISRLKCDAGVGFQF